MTLNVADVYADDRFNKSIDDQTGYSSKSILCMPIQIRGQVIGVIQMVNKKVVGSFSEVSTIHSVVFIRTSFIRRLGSISRRIKKILKEGPEAGFWNI